MNSKNNKTSDPDRILLSLSEKTDLRRSDELIHLPNLRMKHTRKSIKKPQNHKKAINIKYLDQRGMKNLNYLADHILHKKLKIVLNISSKDMKQ